MSAPEAFPFRVQTKDGLAIDSDGQYCALIPVGPMLRVRLLGAVCGGPQVAWTLEHRNPEGWTPIEGADGVTGSAWLAMATAAAVLYLADN